MSDRRGCDVAVIGGGIIGSAAAAMLARAGRRVVLFERAEVAAGASGRNSGVLQHPYDGVLAALHARTLTLYRELGAVGVAGFALAERPAGLLLVADDGEPVRELTRALGAAHPELAAEYLPADQARALEPALGEGVGGCRLETGYPVVPAAATHAYAAEARDAGAELRLGVEARPRISAGRVTGVRGADGSEVDADQVLVAAGPWSPALVPTWADRPPIRPTYGVVVAATLAEPPGHVLEELGIDPGGAEVASSFSLVSAGGQSSVGSTFLERPPEPAELVDMLIERGARYVPALATATVTGVRACARPVSHDGRPLVGAVAGVEGLYVCAGHGPWGMSTGPASAELVVRLMLGLDAEPPRELDARRWPAS